MITLFYHGTKVFLQKEKYSNGRICLNLYDASDGMPFARATVNIPEEQIEENEVIIKDYSENNGMLMFLMLNNIVSGYTRVIICGYENAYVVKLLI